MNKNFFPYVACNGNLFLDFDGNFRISNMAGFIVFSQFFYPIQSTE
jgi:hypothetical protein